MKKEKLIGGNVMPIFAILVFALLSFASAAHPIHGGFAEARFSISGNSVSISDTIIYNTGYYSVNGGSWQSFNLQGTPYGEGQPWLLNSGVGNLNGALDVEGTHFVILFSCSLTNNGQSWDCHGDMENGVMVSKWQLEILEVNSNPDPDPNLGDMASFAQCLTNQGAVMYGLESCSGCRRQKAMFGEDWQYIIEVDCSGRRSECDSLYGVTGYPTWIINGQEYEETASLSRLASLTGCPAP